MLPDFDEDTYPHACVIGGDEVLTLRREEWKTHQLFVKDAGGKLGASTNG